jgi:hypothetical protein
MKYFCNPLPGKDKDKKRKIQIFSTYGQEYPIPSGQDGIPHEFLYNRYSAILSAGLLKRICLFYGADNLHMPVSVTGKHTICQSLSS